MIGDNPKITPVNKEQAQNFFNHMANSCFPIYLTEIQVDGSTVLVGIGHVASPMCDLEFHKHYLGRTGK